MKISTIHIVRGGIGALVLAAGCGTTSVQQHRFKPYRPATPKQAPVEVAAAVTRKAAPATTTPERKPTEPVPPNRQDPPSGVTNPKSHRSVLKPGDRVKISLRSIQNPDEIGEVIDEKGAVSLPHIEDVIIGGLTTAEAEEVIRKKYIDGEFYSKITVIVVAEVERYYVRGHVKKSGEFALMPGLTLSQALTIAGFDPFGNRKSVELIRGNGLTEHNLERIEAGKDPDPVIQSGDKINVPQKGFLNR